jgi:ribosomal protein S14
MQLKNLLYIKHMKSRKLSFSVAYVHSRCLINFRARSVFKRFRMSRITMKQFASCGELMGVAKSSW